MKILHGHSDMENAYEVDGYPYGGHRTKCRWWLETSEKGSQKGKMRMMQQTLNPKTGQWNKPHASVFADFMVLYVDNIGHVHPYHVNLISGPRSLTEFVVSGLFAQLNSEEQAKLEKVIHKGRSYNPSCWARFIYLHAACKSNQNAEEVFKKAEIDRPEDKYLYLQDVQLMCEMVKKEQETGKEVKIM